MQNGPGPAALSYKLDTIKRAGRHPGQRRAARISAGVFSRGTINGPASRAETYRPGRPQVNSIILQGLDRTADRGRAVNSLLGYEKDTRQGNRRPRRADNEQYIYNYI